MVLTQQQSDGPSMADAAAADLCGRAAGGLAIRDACGFAADDLWPFLAMAAHEPDAAAARRVGYLQRFLRDWPRAGDFGFVAEFDGTLAGAAWARRFSPAEAADFHAGARTPELVVAVRPSFRGCGIGEALLERLVREAAARGLDGLCLTVRAENPAARLYARFHFAIVARGRNRVGGQSFGMVRHFNKSPASREALREE